MVIVILAAFTFFLVVIEIWAVNRLATVGEKINQLEASKANLKTENEALENEISKMVSLGKISKDAKEYGFEPLSNIEFLNAEPTHQ